MTSEPNDKPHKLAKALRRDMAAGGYAEGDRIPSHRDLAAIYGVSRDTAGKAVQLLIDDGFLVGGKRHEGTYVAFTHVTP